MSEHETQLWRNEASYWRETAGTYARELDAAAAIIEKVHPIGLVKAIGRREVAQAIADVASECLRLRDLLGIATPQSDPTDDSDECHEGMTS